METKFVKEAVINSQETQTRTRNCKMDFTSLQKFNHGDIQRA